MPFAANRRVLTPFLNAGLAVQVLATVWVGAITRDTARALQKMARGDDRALMPTLDLPDRGPTWHPMTDLVFEEDRVRLVAMADAERPPSLLGNTVIPSIRRVSGAGV